MKTRNLLLMWLLAAMVLSACATPAPTPTGQPIPVATAPRVTPRTGATKTPAPTLTPTAVSTEPTPYIKLPTPPYAQGLGDPKGKMIFSNYGAMQLFGNTFKAEPGKVIPFVRVTGIQSINYAVVAPICQNSGASGVGIVDGRNVADLQPGESVDLALVVYYNATPQTCHGQVNLLIEYGPKGSDSYYMQVLSLPYDFTVQKRSNSQIADVRFNQTDFVGVPGQVFTNTLVYTSTGATEYNTGNVCAPYWGTHGIGVIFDGTTAVGGGGLFVGDTTSYSVRIVDQAVPGTVCRGTMGIAFQMTYTGSAESRIQIDPVAMYAVIPITVTVK